MSLTGLSVTLIGGQKQHEFPGKAYNTEPGEYFATLVFFTIANPGPVATID